MVRYPLSEGDITEATAKAISEAIKDPIQNPGEGAIRRCIGSIKGYPANRRSGGIVVMKEVDGQNSQRSRAKFALCALYP